jgi:hypothetical protein
LVQKKTKEGSSCHRYTSLTGAQESVNSGEWRFRSGDFCAGLGGAASVVSLKFIEEQPQILRLTTPELKDVRGPVRSE